MFGHDHCNNPLLTNYALWKIFSKRVKLISNLTHFDFFRSAFFQIGLLHTTLSNTQKWTIVMSYDTVRHSDTRQQTCHMALLYKEWSLKFISNSCPRASIRKLHRSPTVIIKIKCDTKLFTYLSLFKNWMFNFVSLLKYKRQMTGNKLCKPAQRSGAGLRMICYPSSDVYTSINWQN